MLKSYEVEIEGDRIKWLAEKPTMQSVTGLIVVEENKLPLPTKRTTSRLIAGKGRTLGDIVSPIVDKEDWESLKPQLKLEFISDR